MNRKQMQAHLNVHGWHWARYDLNPAVICLVKDRRLVYVLPRSRLYHRPAVPGSTGDDLPEIAPKEVSNDAFWLGVNKAREQGWL